ncbi:Glucose-6-phosphate 1-dehydrogenase [Actinobacillus indolicus]|nr:Glucose-6-phosphate 1-dehydrogenase [Actinobacillus indolicus]VTU07790.1 Glucose-6-phosphate 1-dehydrogenase [Actinobacillus indolicus]
MLTSKSCSLFDIPFFQFSQMKKYCPEDIPQIKSEYKKHWEIWKKLNLDVYQKLGFPFAEPHIEKWCNGWQVRAHFFAYYKYEFHQNSAAILSVILNRRRLSVSLDWHCYRADRSQINVNQYNQWLSLLDKEKYSDFDIWRGTESEYADFPKVKAISLDSLILENEADFFCIGKNREKTELDNLDALDFIAKTIQELQPLYEKCHL